MMNIVHMYYSLHNKKKSHLFVRTTLFSLIVVVLALFFSPPTTKITSAEKPQEKDLVKTLSLKDKIKQTIICGISETDLNNNLEKSEYCGNYILFEENIKGLSNKEIKHNNDQIHTKDSLSWIMIDQEGGKVARIIDGTPSVRTIGQTDTATYWGDHHGWILKNLSIDVNLAPVGDIGSSSPVIGNRSFGDNPDEVTNSIVDYIKALQGNGIVGVIKHLPGHGRVPTDTHISSGILKYDWKEIQNYEMIPFVNAVDAGARIFMVGHITVPELDNKPASISKLTISTLRNFLPNGNDIIFMTDSLSMVGVGLPAKEAALEALKAGEDMILIPSLPEKEIFDALYQAYSSKLLDIESLDISVARILKVKTAFGKQ